MGHGLSLQLPLGVISIRVESRFKMPGPWNGTPKYDLHRVAEACYQDLALYWFWFDLLFQTNQSTWCGGTWPLMFDDNTFRAILMCWTCSFSAAMPRTNFLVTSTRSTAEDRNETTLLFVCDELQCDILMSLDESNFPKGKWKTSISSCICVLATVFSEFCQACSSFDSCNHLTVAEACELPGQNSRMSQLPFCFSFFFLVQKVFRGKWSVLRRSYWPFCLGFCFPAPWTWNDLTQWS